MSECAVIRCSRPGAEVWDMGSEGGLPHQLVDLADGDEQQVHLLVTTAEAAKLSRLLPND